MKIQENRKIFKSSRYEYSSSSSNTRDGGIIVQPKSYESVDPTTLTTTSTSTNINQLDHLLDDLKQERDYSYDKGKPNATMKRITLSPVSNNILFDS